MIVTLDIDTTNTKALALLNYIKTLDFISVGEKPEITSHEQKLAIDEGLNQLENENRLSHSVVMDETRQRYPQLF
ncbi:MAG: hypothetical protein DRJ05_08195 [Bacteroidetes bacterium]|nr:MAG: hypothetical protein DRJ05_08195 [Bacteroidota bacterium]